jgi:alcohol dehydrogenase, propanol-preferring
MYWGSPGVLDLARTGSVDVHVETYSLDEAPLAHERLHEGKINGRAVILPNG